MSLSKTFYPQFSSGSNQKVYLHDDLLSMPIFKEVYIEFVKTW